MSENVDATFYHKSIQQYDIRYLLISQKEYNFVTIRDLKSNKQFIIHALKLAQNERMIIHFSPRDACKIGIMAGIAYTEI